MVDVLVLPSVTPCSVKINGLLPFCAILQEASTKLNKQNMLLQGITPHPQFCILFSKQHKPFVTLETELVFKKTTVFLKMLKLMPWN